MSEYPVASSAASELSEVSSEVSEPDAVDSAAVEDEVDVEEVDDVDSSLPPPQAMAKSSATITMAAKKVPFGKSIIRSFRDSYKKAVCKVLEAEFPVKKRIYILFISYIAVNSKYVHLIR